MFKQKACKLLFSALWANIPRQPLAIMYSRNTHIRVQPKKERGNHFAFSTHAYRINNGKLFDGIGRVTSPRTNSANRGLWQRAHLQLISANSNPVSNLTGKLLWSGASFKSLNSVSVNSVLLMGFIRLSNNVLISNNKPSYFTCQAIYYLFVFNI